MCILCVADTGAGYFLGVHRSRGGDFEPKHVSSGGNDSAILMAAGKSTVLRGFSH